MARSSTSKKRKPEPMPEAVSSLILGIMGLSAAITMVAMVVSAKTTGHLYYGYDIWGVEYNLAAISLRWGWLFSVIGLTLGIMGIKSSFKKLAIVGIALSAVTLLYNLAVVLRMQPFYPGYYH